MSHRKPDDERQRRNKPRYLQQCLTWDGVKRGPELPDEYDWCQMTVDWYEDFRVSPNAMLTEDSDWEHIMIAALLHNKLWSNSGSRGLTPSEMTNLSKEIRTRMAPYGYTNEDRLRLNIEFGDAPNEEETSVKSTSTGTIDYEALLSAPPVKD